MLVGRQVSRTRYSIVGEGVGEAAASSSASVLGSRNQTPNFSASSVKAVVSVQDGQEGCPVAALCSRQALSMKQSQAGHWRRSGPRGEEQMVQVGRGEGGEGAGKGMWAGQ